MKTEMPVRHWATLPESTLIPDLIQNASEREITMRQAPLESAAPFVPEKHTFPVLTKAAKDCKGCHLYQNATQTVFGIGPSTAHIMLVGEQPGDQEDREGLPFVGPAGKMLDRALMDAGIPRAEVYVTNAVKHFKFEERGKRRIHKTPLGSEIAACHPWLEAEMDALKPKLVVCMGATATRAVAGKDFKITRDRGRLLPFAKADAMIITVHPSFLLRIPEESRKREEYERFVADFEVVKHEMERLRA
jgi:DNA polymerase